MRIIRQRIARAILTFLLVVLASPFCAIAAFAQGGVADPLPSWNDGASKKSILDFVARVTKEGGSDYVSPEHRIATFDNDGTLWSEHPVYTEVIFALDRIKELAPQHPEWQTEEPFATVLHGDAKTPSEISDKNIVKLWLATHCDMTTVQFTKIVSDWIAHAKQPRFKRLYTDCVYQPMLEVLSYLRANGFKTYIVSGGEIGFMRPWTQKTYGIPPEQVIGTTFKTDFKIDNDKTSLEIVPQLASMCDGRGKPENINRFIGKRPILAFGNSDGDLQMLEWTASGTGPSLMLLVHHTDAEREYAYDADTSYGRLKVALTEAIARHWTVVDMKNDWKTIFPAQTK